MASRPRRGGDGRGGAGSFLVVVGGLVVLGLTFTGGVMAGRSWSGSPFLRSEPAARAGRDRGREREARTPEPPPTLTFYQELTAPLTSPPPPSKPAKPPRAEASKPDSVKPNAATGPAPDVVKAEATTASGSGRFTVQVGAYKAREPAEALRASLAAVGADAYVVEADGPGGVRFRVRVGAYDTREAAQRAAARIAADHTLSAFVTAR